MPLGFSFMRPGLDAADKQPVRALQAHHTPRHVPNLRADSRDPTPAPATAQAPATPAPATPLPAPPPTSSEEEPYEPLIAWQKLRKLY